MGSLDKLETTLDTTLDKHVPFKLPDSARKALAGAMWWIAAVFGVLDLWAAYQVWDWGHKANKVVDAYNAVFSYYGVERIDNLGFFYYLAVAVIALVGVLLLLAVPGLKAMKKAGWNLLFYALLVQVAAAIIRLFVDGAYGGGFGNFLASLLFAAVGAYFLFQIRSSFMTPMPADKVATTAPKPPKK
jgi:hypothetical protein